MQVDKTTIADLSIFHHEEEQSVFQHLNFTHTNGGREYLRIFLANPLSSTTEIIDIQKTIQRLMEVEHQWPTGVSNGTVMVLEKFYETQLNRFSQDANIIESYFYMFFNKSDYSLIRYSVEHTHDFVKGLQQIVDMLQEQGMSSQMSLWITRISMLLNKPMIQSLIQEDKKALKPRDILHYGSFIRSHFKSPAFELIDIYYKLDAYLSMAMACKKYRFCFPEVTDSEVPFIKADGLFHLLLPIPVSYDIGLSPESNFLFLTGANMAGKSTFIKAVGITAYLAHLGMGVPAKDVSMSFFDGILSNIQVVDNILKGESFFFNEVQRIKKTIEQISDGKKWLILIDELFKGTNQQDAVKCSTTVIEGLRKMKNALFILSTHLYEIGEDLKKYDNIQFHFFETSVNEDQLEFSYQLKPGISNDRLGYLILRKEGVVALLEKI